MAKKSSKTPAPKVFSDGSKLTGPDVGSNSSSKKVKDLPRSPAVQFGVKVKSRLEDHPDLYRAYLDIIDEIGTTTFDAGKLNKKLEFAFSNQQDLIDEFRVIYPSLSAGAELPVDKTLRSDTVILEKKEPLPLPEDSITYKSTPIIKHARLRLLAKGMASIQDPSLAGIGYSSLLLSSLTGSTKLKSLYSMISDFRMFCRVWGTAGLAEWAFDTAKGAESSTHGKFDQFIVKVEAYSSLIYQILEDVAYLSSKGVIKISPKLEGKIWILSCVFWALYVQLELIRLAKVIITSKGKIIPWKEVFVNSAWLPLTIHWSMEKGFLGDRGIGFFGAAASLPNAIGQWKSLI